MLSSALSLNTEDRQKLSNWRWRLNNLYNIVDKSRHRIRFQENAVQQRLNDSGARHRAVLKARQQGVSTNELLRMFDFTIWNEDVTACILAHETDAIKKLFRIVRRAYELMPDFLRPVIPSGGSMYEMYFPATRSRIYCDLESRGDTIHWLHVSEYAFAKNIEKVQATMDAVPTETGIITIETTPNGMANHFFDFWKDSSNSYEKLFFPWYMHPEYEIETRERIQKTPRERELSEMAQRRYGIKITNAQIMWRRAKIASYPYQGERMFMQEYPSDDDTCFLTTGDAVFDGELLADLKAAAPEKPQQIIPLRLSERGGRRPGAELRIYEPYDKERRYVIGADTAEGGGRDYSAAIVLDIESMRQVATAHGKHKPGDFAEILYQLGRRYQTGGRRWPLLGVEENNHGHAVLLELRKHLKYPRLYYRDEKREKVGWLTSLATRPLLVDTCIEAIENGTLIIQDRAIFDECMTLVDNNKKIEAAPNKHDDLFIASAIALQMAIEAKRSDFIDSKRSFLVG